MRNFAVNEDGDDIDHDEYFHNKQFIFTLQMERTNNKTINGSGALSGSVRVKQLSRYCSNVRSYSEI